MFGMLFVAAIVVLDTLVSVNESNSQLRHAVTTKLTVVLDTLVSVNESNSQRVLVTQRTFKRCFRYVSICK